MSVLNVLSIVRCIGVNTVNGDADQAPEICAAFELLQREIRRIAAALKNLSCVAQCALDTVHREERVDRDQLESALCATVSTMSP